MLWVTHYMTVFTLPMYYFSLDDYLKMTGYYNHDVIMQSIRKQPFRPHRLTTFPTTKVAPRISNIISISQEEPARSVCNDSNDFIQVLDPVDGIKTLSGVLQANTVHEAEGASHHHLGFPSAGTIFSYQY